MTAAAGGDGTAAPPSAEARLKALYSVMQSLENRLGGGEGVEGLYGSIKKGGMERVLGCMRDKCGLGASSILVDVGAGLGRPLMHALLEPGVAGARGIEIDRIKCDKAAAFLRQAVAELRRRGAADDALTPPPVECCAIENVGTLEPCTHAYSFWEGVPVEGKAAFGRLFAASRSLRAVAVVQRAVRTCPLAYMADLGFGELQLAASFPVSMSGSGRSFTAYVFNRADQPAALQPPLAAEQAGLQSVQTPGQGGEGARAAVSTGAVAAAAEVEGETAQSRLAAGAVEPAVASGGRRQRRPSAKQQAAEEEREASARQTQQQAQQRRARQQRASRRTKAATEGEDAGAADAAAEQAEQAAAGAAAPADVAAGAPQAGPRPAPAARTRSVSRPAGPAPLAKPAGRLGSPAKGGVRKAANRSPPKAEPTVGARRGLALGGGPGKGGPDSAAAHAPGSAGLLQRAARVIKSGVADGVSRLRPARAAATAARRGLKTD